MSDNFFKMSDDLFKINRHIILPDDLKKFFCEHCCYPTWARWHRWAKHHRMDGRQGCGQHCLAGLRPQRPPCASGWSISSSNLSTQCLLDVVETLSSHTQPLLLVETAAGDERDGRPNHPEPCGERQQRSLTNWGIINSLTLVELEPEVMAWRCQVTNINLPEPMSILIYA